MAEGGPADSSLLKLVAQLDTGNDNDIVGANIKNLIEATYPKKNDNKKSIEQIFRLLKEESDFILTRIRAKVFKEFLNHCQNLCASKGLSILVIEKCDEIEEAYIDHGRYVLYLGECRGIATAKAELYAKKEEEGAIEIDPTRIAPFDYKIEGTVLQNTCDLDRLEDRVNTLFHWFGRDNTKNYNSYIAPYFPLIQSSGTGKTLLLYNLKQRLSGKKNADCSLFICVKTDIKSRIHENFPVDSLQTNGSDLRKFVWKQLDDLLRKTTCNKVVWLFDEAQILLEYDAFYFRCMRLWLRLKRDKNVVAMFVGTSSKLSDSFPDKLLTSNSSHSLYRNQNVKNLMFYDPFFELTTVAVKAPINKNDDLEEYERAAMYGRPLFALLQNDVNNNTSLNENLRYKILQRMLFQNTNSVYKNNATVLMNILGTRVQMGHVSASLSSILVARGYAHLVGFNLQSTYRSQAIEKKLNSDEDVVRISYLPDPVCAHLAMCLMDGTSSWNDGEVTGCEPSFWTEKARQLFSSGICHTRKGDVGEVAAALYFLFCSDKERRLLDRSYMRFSVDLQRFIGRLIASNGKLNALKADVNSVVYQVNFIQFVQQEVYVSLDDWCNQETLEWMYNSACAYYLAAQARVFNMIASVKFNTEQGQPFFIPFLVRVQSRLVFDNAHVEVELEGMRAEMKACQIKGAFCLLIIFDLQTNNISNDHLLCFEDGANDLTNNVICKVLVLSPQDEFGIYKLVKNTAFEESMKCGVYTNHSIMSTLDQRMLDSYKQSQLLGDELTQQDALTDSVNKRKFKRKGAKRKSIT